MADRVPMISRCSAQLAYGWAEARRCVRRSLQSLLRFEDVVSLDLFGSANPDARTAYRSGRACMDPNVGLYDTAVSWFSKAINLDATFAQAWLGRAQAYLKISNLDNAIVDFSAFGHRLIVPWATSPLTSLDE